MASVEMLITLELIKAFTANVLRQALLNTHILLFSATSIRHPFLLKAAISDGVYL